MSDTTAFHNQHQQPIYDDRAELAVVLKKLSTAPVFTSLDEITALKRRLARVSTSQSFVIQAGDCVERFDFMNDQHVPPRLNLLLKMGVRWQQLTGTSPVLIARMGGQLFKPRSKPTEPSIWGPIASFRGEAVHSYKKDHVARSPDPHRLIKAHELITETIRLKQSIAPQVFFSHEALHLGWEKALIRSESAKHYLGSAPLVWVGERTRDIDSPHIEMLRSAENVIGIKIGPTGTPRELRAYCLKLNPNNEPGKLVFILRLGLDGSTSKINTLLDSFKRLCPKQNVTWLVDPMHGNKHASLEGQKFRSFFEILSEVRLHASAHEKNGTKLGGVHLESTPESISEILGGAKISKGVRQEQLLSGFDSYCDPRLNKHQCVELVESLAQWCSS